MLPVWLLILVFAAVQSAYIALVEGLLLYAISNLLNIYPIAYSWTFLIAFVLNIGFSIVHVRRLFKDES